MEVSTIYLRVSPLPVESERSVVRRRGQALSQFSTLSLLLRIIRLRLNKSVDTNQKRHYNITFGTTSERDVLLWFLYKNNKVFCSLEFNK